MAKDNHLLAEASPEAIVDAIRRLRSDHPSIKVELSSDSTAEGDDVTASCRISANPPVVASDILWTVGGVRVENASGPTLQLNSVTSDMDLQLVECRARNAIGTSSSATPLRVTCKFFVFEYQRL